MHFEVRDAQTTIYSFSDPKVLQKENHFPVKNPSLKLLTKLPAFCTKIL